MISLFSWQGQNQVWPITEFSSVCFSQSRIGVKSAFSTNAISRFASVVVDSFRASLRTNYANLDYVFVENALFYTDH